MAEILAIGPAIIAVVQIADRIVSLCKHYIQTVQDAPSDLKIIFVEISALKTILADLEFLKSCDNEPESSKDSHSRVDQPVKECLRLVKELEQLFPSGAVQTLDQGSKKRKLKARLTELAWPLKETKARRLLEGIRPLKETLNLELTSQSRQDIREIKAEVLKANEILIETQRSDVFRWLRHTDTSPLFYKATQDYEPGTGDWVLRLPEWQDWVTLKTRCLWIHGIPGAGKTFLMAHLIEVLKERMEAQKMTGCVCVYYFCFYGHNQDETIPFLKCLLECLCRSSNTIPAEVLRYHRDGVELNLASLLGALKALLREFTTVYVFIDALDESKGEENLLSVLQDLMASEGPKNIQILASSREYSYIQRVMEEISVPLSMDNDFVSADIRVYVRSYVHSSGRFARFTPDLLDEIEDAVSKGARGMFRWAVCQLDIVRRLKCERENIQNALKNLPETLHETYDRIFQSFTEAELLVVHSLLQWMQFHSDLFAHGIPCHILAKVAEEATMRRGVSQYKFYHDKETLQELCGCLIKMFPATSSDLDTYNTLEVNFAHYTVREYLDASRLMQDHTAKLATRQESLMKQPLSAVFAEAHKVHLNTTGMHRIKVSNSSSILDAVFGDFNIFCTMCALFALRILAQRISEHETLFDIALGLLDPSNACFSTICTILDSIERNSFFFNDLIDRSEHFWVIKWTEAQNRKCMQMTHLIYWTFCRRSTMPVTKKFIEGPDLKLLTHEHTRFEMTVYTGCKPKKMERYEDFEFDGTLIEAIVSCYLPAMNGLSSLLEMTQSLVDASKILRLFIGRHEHVSCVTLGTCIVEQLLAYGAVPNAQSYNVTPLQIAVRYLDLYGILILLKAGADPNDSGSNEGDQWREGSYMSLHNDLQGKSPLYICRYDETYKISEKAETRRREVEEILVRYGAEDSATQEVAGPVHESIKQSDEPISEHSISIAPMSSQASN
ncbi:uncharacterized protein KY384_002936 [Bacidia gigantensis]|uniref:uncharacterized protein n=1 Tax=Bacidia gigantensis TaxID=2732470 RepID=UPI001D052E37|nr:uncharacterized protein KY384_002936 [Bacidia gigantensis]KAG8531308.1 hypothetical protein KY384_002936 [Bacidia gigantensis]